MNKLLLAAAVMCSGLPAVAVEPTTEPVPTEQQEKMVNVPWTVVKGISKLVAGLGAGFGSSLMWSCAGVRSKAGWFNTSIAATTTIAALTTLKRSYKEFKDLYEVYKAKKAKKETEEAEQVL